MTDDSTASPFVGGLRRGETAAKHFMILSNLAARDPRMSLRARGLFTTGMSFAEGWKITEHEFMRHCSDGEKTIRAGLVELRDLGYVYRGRRSRYAPGTKNRRGKDIGGALGPYEWFFTDKPDEIASILAQCAQEERARIAEAEQETAGRDYLPEREVVPPPPVDNQDLAAPEAGSPDQAKDGIPPGRDYLPASALLPGSTKEDQPGENQEENQGPAASGGDAFGAPDALRLSGPDDSAATGLRGPDPMDHLPGDHQNARAEIVEGELRALEDLARSRKWTPPVPPAPRTRPLRGTGPRRTRREDLDPDQRARLRTAHQAATVRPHGPAVDGQGSGSATG